eukprot:5430564-Pyramimonas_sp.AAC.1
MVSGMCAAHMPTVRRMERATERSAQWLQAPHAYMPYGRDIRPRSQRRTERPVIARSGNSAISG